MKFSEAMAALEEGKKIRSSGWYNGHYLELKDGTLVRESGLIWHDDPFFFFDVWELYEVPEVANGLWVSHRPIERRVNTIFSLQLKNFDLYGEAIAWEDTLSTLMELKGHPLAVKAQDIITQHLLRFDPATGSITTLFYNGLCFKYDSVSPCFNSDEDALRAIKDIGEERLIHMFKTLQGVYE